MRILFLPSPTDVCYAGIALAHGTRHELDSESGLAHFTEHMSFKGTQHLTSMQILSRIDAVGGELNAYTAKEETVYYATFGKEYLDRAIDLLVDIVFRSTYPQQEIDKEVEVVCDEIESYNDSPSELIFDEFETLLFPAHPLGRNILGTAERLREYTTADFEHFVQRGYTPENALFFVRGRVDEDHVRRRVEQALQQGEGRKAGILEFWKAGTEGAASAEECLHSFCRVASEEDRSSIPAIPRSLYREREMNTHQAHVMMGTAAYGMNHPRRMALSLLNNVLGGPSMNSRLNIALREKAGLVYTVETNYMTYSDAGVWSIYFGCDPHDVERCSKLVNKELRRLIDTPLTPRTLAAVKRQMQGQLRIATDNFQDTTLSAAKRMLLTGHVATTEEVCQQIEALDATTLQETAAEIFEPNRLTTLMYH